jgi:hypothetical protein
MPPVPAFYLRPRSVDEVVRHTVARALDLVGIDVPGTPRWGEVDPNITDPNTSTTLTDLNRKALR